MCCYLGRVLVGIPTSRTKKLEMSRTAADEFIFETEDPELRVEEKTSKRGADVDPNPAIDTSPVDMKAAFQSHEGRAGTSSNIARGPCRSLCPLRRADLASPLRSPTPHAHRARSMV